MATLNTITGLTLPDITVPGLVTLPSNTLLSNANELGTITEYFIEEDNLGPDTIVAGDTLNVEVNNGTPIPGTYIGSGVLSFANVSLGNPLLGASLAINPINVNYVRGTDGVIRIIAPNSLSSANLTVSGTVTVGGVGIPVNGNLTGIAALLQSAGLNVNQVLNAANISLSFDPNGTLTLGDDITTMICFAAGSLIDTANGPRAVETLVPGDLVRTRDRGLRPLAWTGHRALDAKALARNPKLTPIRIKAGALGVDMPMQDLVVSPQHRMLVRSKIALRMFGCEEVLVPAKHLLAMEGISEATDLDSVVYVHIMFDCHEVITANGALTESLFGGPQALKMVGPEGREELLTLFPELADPDHMPVPARVLPPNRQVRTMALRHQRNGVDLVG